MGRLTTQSTGTIVYLFIMKAWIFFIVSLCGAKIVAQPTITSSQMPKSGDTLRYSNALPTELPSNYETGGANMSWDFSAMTPQRQQLLNYYSATKTPYSFYFFGQIGQKTADTVGAGPITLTNVYSFYTNSSKVFKAEGIGYQYSGFPLASMYKDEDEIYQFPLNYGDKDTSTFNFRFSIPGDLFALVQAGTRYNDADGWGTIKTPYKEYTNVLRLRTYVDEIDTVTSQFGKFPLPRKTVSYKWLSLSERIPVMEVSGTVNPLTGAFTANQVRYRDGFIGRLDAQGIEASGAGLSVYPNPVVDVLQVEVRSSMETWSATDVAGAAVPVVWLAPGLLDVRGWLPGVYTLSNGSHTVKICKL